METLLANLSGKVRRTTLNGREYLVAPLTMLQEGVLKGSKGPAYYPADLVTNQALANLWNGMPMVVYHPQGEDGSFLSARNPEVSGKSEVGRVYNAHVHNGDKAKLRAEGWFDVEACNRVDKRIVNDLEADRPIELSTGLGVATLEPVANAADYNGKAYDYTVTHYTPDHLAILPDMAGACSLKDGCGVLANRLSHSDTRDQICEKLREMYPLSYDGDVRVANYAYVTDVYDDYFVYLRGNDLYRQAYSVKDNEVSISPEAPQKVLRVVEYVPTNNAETPTPTEGQIAMPTKQEQVTYLVANCDCWKGQEKALETTPDSVVNHLYDQAKAKDAPAVPAPVTQPVVNALTGIVNALNGQPVPVAQPVSQQPLSMDQWLAAAPPEAKPVWNHAVELEKAERTRLVAQLVANVADQAQKTATGNYLMQKPLDELRMLVSLQPAPVNNSTPFFPNQSVNGMAVPNYAYQPQGQHGLAAGYVPTQVVNQDFLDDDALELPVINWAEASREKDREDELAHPGKSQARAS